MGLRYLPWLCDDSDAILGGRGYRAPFSGLSEARGYATGEEYPYIEGWGDVAREDGSPSELGCIPDVEAGEGARSEPSNRSLSTDDLCLGKTPNSRSPDDELLSLDRPVSSGARTGLMAGVLAPELRGGDSLFVDAGMGGESGRVEGVATG